MGKDKLKRFAEMEHFDNVFQPSMEEVKEGFSMKGKWHADFFKNDHPIVVELGCGRGEYTVGMAQRYPEKNFIGIDIKGSRIWRGAKTGVEDQMPNVGFVRSKVDFIEYLFAENEVSEIWLTFSDPQPKRPRKRLSSKLFVDRYRKIMKSDGVVNMKTDSDLLFESTLEQIEEHGYQKLLSSWDVYGELVLTASQELIDLMEIKTFYEQKWLEEGKKIKFVQFTI
ncbi:MAG: tRNA (guanosine(46)-N7)-methyltransferase TrmB [Flavobacteriales bacterium]|jgi:tRNA (guanine-N7-)-methyltransferase|nr:tRNA (guanosine(46)-N7)-methyltransferase TrmB [Flavobacteriales bacterium]